jgi:hypothetical protein
VTKVVCSRCTTCSGIRRGGNAGALISVYLTPLSVAESRFVNNELKGV